MVDRAIARFDAVSGKYRNETRRIFRETFHAEKMRDAFVACCWSFGNDLNSYMCSKQIEPYKKAVHYAVFFDDLTQFIELCHEVWCVDVSKTNRVFVSEYSIKDPRFVVVAQKEKICIICSTVTKKKLLKNSIR